MNTTRIAIAASLLLCGAAHAQEQPRYGSFIELKSPSKDAATPLFSSIFDVHAPADGETPSFEVLKDENGQVAVTIQRRPLQAALSIEPKVDATTSRQILVLDGQEVEAAVVELQETTPASRSSGNDTYDVAEASTIIVDDGGWDTITSTATRDLVDFPDIENVVLMGNADIDATGNVRANRLVGNDGANRLEGLGGADVLIGGKGDDAYVLAAATNDTIEDVEGIDTVESTISRDLRDFSGIEDLVLTHSANVDGMGDDGANRLVGNIGTNRLEGRGGDDVIDGGLGPDTLTGGEGKDVFVLASVADTETSTGHRDIIEDFQAGIDRIDLSALADGFELRFVDEASFSGKPGEVRWFKMNKDFLILEIDTNGDGSADAQIQVSPVRKLTKEDLLLTPRAIV